MRISAASTAKTADARMMARTFVMISLITAARAFTGALARRASPLRKRTARFASHPVSMRMRTWPLLKTNITPKTRRPA